MAREVEQPEIQPDFDRSNVIVTGLTGTNFRGLFEAYIDKTQRGDDESAPSLYGSLAGALDFAESEQVAPSIVVILPANADEWLDSFPANSESMHTIGDDLTALNRLQCGNVPFRLIAGDHDLNVLGLEYILHHGGQPNAFVAANLVDELTTDIQLEAA